MTLNPLGSLWADGTALVTGVVTTLALPLHLRGKRLAALLEEPAGAIDWRLAGAARPSYTSRASGTGALMDAVVVADERIPDCRGGPCARPSNVAAASGAAGRPQGPPLQSGTAADLRDWIASDAAGRPQGPPLQSGPPADPTPLALRAGLYTLRLLARTRLPGWRNSCLYRAALHCLLLRRAGQPAVLRIGARRGGIDDTTPVTAHAWVERLGEAIPAEAQPYTTLRRSTAPA